VGGGGRTISFEKKRTYEHVLILIFDITSLGIVSSKI
jgi:hypothetical protein